MGAIYKVPKGVTRGLLLLNLWLFSHKSISTVGSVDTRINLWVWFPIVSYLSLCEINTWAVYAAHVQIVILFKFYKCARESRPRRGRGSGFVMLTQKNESWNLRRAQILWAAVPTSGGPGPDWDLFSLSRGERSDNLPHLVFCFVFLWLISNKGSKSNQRRENKRRYLTWAKEKRRKGVILERLARWVNSPAISSHSNAERSRLSLKWYLGSDKWKAQEVGSCVWPEIGNHSRKLDKIQEWRIRLSRKEHFSTCLPGWFMLIWAVFVFAPVQHL